MKKYKSRFKALVRIDPKQRDWLKDNKDTRTIAGYLDKLINRYKKDRKYIITIPKK